MKRLAKRALELLMQVATLPAARLAFHILLFVTAGIAFGLVVLVPYHNAAVPVVTISSLELGGLAASDVYQQSLTIDNVSDSAVLIKDFQTSCSCTSIPRQELILSPRTSYSVPFVIDVPSGLAAGSVLSIEVVAVYESEYHSGIARGRLTGHLLASARSTPLHRTVSYNPGNTADAPPQDIVDVHVDNPLTELNCTHAPDFMSVDVVAVSPTLRRIRVKAHSAGDAFIDTAIALPITAYLNDELSWNTVVPIALDRLSDAAVHPGVLFLGIVQAGMTCTKSVTIVPRVADPIRVCSVRCIDNSIRATIGTHIEELTSEGAPISIPLVLIPERVGANSATVLLQIQVAARPIIDVPVRISWITQP